MQRFLGMPSVLPTAANSSCQTKALWCEPSRARQGSHGTANDAANDTANDIANDIAAAADLG